VIIWIYNFRWTGCIDPETSEFDARKRLLKSFGPFQHHSSENSTYAASMSGMFEPIGTIDYGEIYPAENPSVAEEQKGITPVEREALELSMKSHRRAIDLLAQH